MKSFVLIWFSKIQPRYAQSFWLILLLVCSSASGFGQVTSVTADQAPPIPGAGHDYIHLLSETVSPAFGSVNIRIGTPMPPGREGTVPFAFQYDSGGSLHFTATANTPTDNTSYLGRGGWSYIFPLLQVTETNLQVGPPPPASCYTYDNFIFSDTQGTMHSLGLEVNPGQQQACFIPGQSWPTQVTRSSDGFVTATTPLGNSSPPPPPSVTVFDLDGTVFTFSGGVSRYHPVVSTGDFSYIYNAVPDWIETRNGNKVVIADNGNGALQMTDSAGRVALSTSGFGASGNTVSISGLGNPYTITWANQSANFTYQNQLIFTANHSSDAFCTADGTHTFSNSQPEITQITLPNGQSYQFQYDPTYGMVDKIIYPSGGYVRYVWGLNANSTSSIAVAHWNQSSGGPPPNPSVDVCEYLFPSVAVQHRYVSFDGTHEVLQQDFAYSATTWAFTSNPYEQWTSKQTAVTTTDLVTGLVQKTVYNYSAAAIPELGVIPPAEGGTGVHPVTPVETQVQYEDGNSKILRTVNKAYGNPYLSPVDQKITLDNGQVSEVQNCFITAGFYSTGSLCPSQSGQVNLLTDTFELGYGNGSPGPLLRRTHTDYAALAATPLGASIVDRPCRIITYDGAGTRTAETDYFYDGGTAVCGAAGTPSVTSVSNLPPGTHDDTNYSATSTAPRGNATKVTRKCFIPSTGSTCTDAVTTYSYDETGQVSSMTDPNGNMTQYSYTDSFTDTTPANNTNAYLTKITHPQTGTVNHIESFSYAYSDGQLTVAKDQNLNQTKYFYSDPLRRLTETDFPDTGQTTVTYNDSALTVVTNKKMDSNHTFITTTVADGMGHPVQTQINSDPSGIDYVDTSYDGLGRIISSSNPHRSTSATTDGVTQTQYDVLGRPTRVTRQDSSVSTASYTANCSVALDEAGKRRRSCSDALGRLTEVDEPTPGVSESIQATNASANVSLSGSLQSKSGSNPATGTVTIVGTDSIVPGTSSYDFGTVTVTVGGASVTVNYGNFGASPSTASDVASALCSSINSTSSTSSQVSCSPSGAVMNLTAQAAGTAGNGIPLAVSAQTQFPQSNQSAFANSFTSGSLSGGGALIYDSGTTTITIVGRAYGLTWSGSATTPTSIASSLASAINNDSGSFATATASGGTVTVFANVLGMSGNGISVACSSTYDSSNFSGPSFTISCPSTLSGGHEAGSLSAPVVTLYNYNALGDLLQATQQGGTSDQTQWRVRTFTYDSLGRLLTANNPESGQLSYSYDANSNMLQKVVPAPNQSGAGTVTTTYVYDALNRVTQKSYSDGTTPAVFFLYDTASNWGNPSVTQTNLIGRLSLIYENGTTTTGNQVFSYDTMGRVLANNQCTPSNCGTGNYPLSATYDLAGNLTSLTYPSGRLVKYFYNAGDLLDQVQFFTFNGVAPSGGAFNYWVAADNNFHPNGVPKSWTFGNGVVESTTLNNRLQLQEETVGNPAIYTFADHVYNYGTQNNGNVQSVTDQLNSSRTQTFTYDALNRLSTANEGRWGLGFVYDAWGNRLQQNVTAGAAGGIQITVDAKNHIQGAPSNCTAGTRYCYDAAGNLLHDNLDHQYVYDAENRIKLVDSGVATYTYNAEGSRVRKDVSGSPSTEYLYFNGNVIAERNVSTGDWTDYVWAYGKRIAKAMALDNGLRIYGTRCGSCGSQYSLFYLSVGGLAGYTIRSGDKLDLTQYQVTGSHGGIVLVFTDGTNTNWNLRDQDTYFANDDGTQNTTHVRRMDLGSFVGKTIQQIALNQESDTAAGSFAIIYEQAVLTSSDGTVQPIYTGESTSPVSSIFATSGVTGTASHIDVNEGKGIYPTTTTTYYHTNQINSSTLVTAGSGWPVWQATYLPYGEEYNPEIGTEHYKFSGKERDSETSLDYFGERYYASLLARFMTTDPIHFQASMLGDPQRFNLYAYVRNNPLTLLDPKGEAIELTGDDEERKRQLEAWQNSVGGGKAGQYLYDNVDPDTGKHYVGIYTNGPDGKGPDFASISGLTKALSGIINDPQIGQLDFKAAGSVVTDDRNGLSVTIGKVDPHHAGQVPGAVTYSNEDHKFHFNILDKEPYGELPASYMSDHKPGVLNRQFLIAHEAMGHGFLPNGDFSNSRAVNLENQARQAKNPDAPYRLFHDPPLFDFSH